MKEWHFINPRTNHAEYRIRVGVHPGGGEFFAEMERVSAAGKLMRAQLGLTIKEADSIRLVLTEQGFNFIEAK